MKTPTEQQVHIAVVEWFNYQYPEFKDDFHHFANERKCSSWYGALLKKMGVKRGVSDFHLGIACGGFHGMWLELKVEKGRLSKEQKSFIERKRRRGYFASCAWGFEEAIGTIKDYLESDVANCSSFNLKNCA